MPEPARRDYLELEGIMAPTDLAYFAELRGCAALGLDKIINEVGKVWIGVQVHTGIEADPPAKPDLAEPFIGAVEQLFADDAEAAEFAINGIFKGLQTRRKITDEIGVLKARYDLPVKDPEKEKEVMEFGQRQAARWGLPPIFVERLVELVIDDACERQREIVENHRLSQAELSD